MAETPSGRLGDPGEGRRRRARSAPWRGFAADGFPSLFAVSCGSHVLPPQSILAVAGWVIPWAEAGLCVPQAEGSEARPE